jgi:molecular chaperone GrpE
MMSQESELTTEQTNPSNGGPQTAESEAGEAIVLRTQLAQAQAQAAEYLDSWRRATADLSNARKRMQREAEEYRATAAARVLEKLLPITDDVARAFDNLPANQEPNDWVNGFRMIQRKLDQLLESEGATIISTEGQSFDPMIHFAVSHEAADGYAEGQIIAEVGRGYRLGERVLRPSMVRVAK